eukprot:TRINITY_DN12697_c0_g1_i1.p1 TRINITY_DN12697_c0_g1~~TRINITY_DN12697_c0_g1_i1.p1  ORF type:complete len:742 (+),score=248.43 TRINITY_DN12697_c0_g1_i1:126-2228(+)
MDPKLEELIRQEKASLEQEEQQGQTAEQTPVSEDVLIEENEQVVGPASTSEFQAETKKILDIVARSIYSDKEVFVRELISNASDALEKVRHHMVNNKDVCDPELPLEIRISVDDKKKTFTIQDFGLGMTKAELQQNLGKIGFSGTGEFLKVLNDKDKSSNLIGQFGVGFYSAFMTGDHVKVYSKGHSEEGSRGWVWESDGSGSYTIAQAEPVSRGTKIVISLRQNCEEFSNKKTVENIIKTYSNFVGFPIFLNGAQVNTVGAVWTKQPKDVTPEQHKEFYQFIARAYDSPLYTQHFVTDTPLALKCLFYVPETHMEKYGMGRQEIGVSLFSRKILIQAKCKSLVPDWMRFIKGVVDSEDVPLNISREHLQDSALIKRISNVISKRIIKFLEKEATSNPEKYAKFYAEFSQYLKEGVCTDYVHKEDIANLLRMESSMLPPGKFTSLPEYLQRMPKEQTDIYYLIVPNRAYAEQSPYFESFKEKEIEVLFLYDTRLDDFVFSNLAEFKGKKLKTIESSSASADFAKDQSSKAKKEGLTSEQFKDFSKWMKDILVDKLTTVTETDRLSNTPMIIVDHESATFRRMMMQVDPKNAPELPKQQVQVNSKHPLILSIEKLRKTNPGVAKDAIEQIFDNALIQAGLIDDGRAMVPRINKILQTALDSISATAPQADFEDVGEQFTAPKATENADLGSEFKEVPPHKE